MARVRQPYDEPVIVPWLGDREVSPGEIVGVPDDALPSYLAAGWEPGDAETKRKAKALAAVAAEQAGDVAGETEIEDLAVVDAPAEQAKE